MMERIQELKDALQALVVSDDYKDWANAAQYREASAIITKSILSEDEFWPHLDLNCELMKPVYEFIQLNDSCKPMVGIVYHKMFQLQEYLNGMKVNHVFTEELKSEIFGKFMNLWTYVHTDLHCTGFVLDPRFHKYQQHKNPEVMLDFQNIVEKVYNDVDEQVSYIKRDVWPNCCSCSNGDNGCPHLVDCLW